MEALFPPEDNHHLDLDALTAPGILFFAATGETETLGTAALAIRPGYGEVKSMFTAPAARGRGVGAALLVRIEAEARALGLATLRLETGDRLAAARRLYERFGFVPCPPFGGYRAGGTSLFYVKSLG